MTERDEEFEAAARQARPSGQVPGTPDGYERLWTPHRLVYLETGQQPSKDDCPFCLAPGQADQDDSLVVHLGQTAYAVLNLYPYNVGHLLICPYRHIPTYDLATPEEIAEMGALTQDAMRTLRQVYHAQGFNIGMNQGMVAGAGIAGHLHQHIVPRWQTDANFFPIIARTKAMPNLLGEVRTAIRSAWPGSDEG